MSDTPETVGIGHNMPPVVLPKEDAMLADLKKRYPETESKFEEWDAALATYPEELSLDRPDEAEALQDLLNGINKTKRGWDKADQPAEKKPLNALVKIVTNFFTKPVEKAEALLAVWQPRHQAYLDAKAEANRRAAEEEAEKQRKIAEAKAAEAAKAEEEKRRAEEAAAEARRREDEARAAALRAAEDKRLAEEATARAQAEEKRLAEEKRANDRAEKQRNEEGIRSAKRYLKDAEKLHERAEGEEETSDNDNAVLDNLIKHGGIISTVMGPVASSPLLNDEQKEDVQTLRKTLEQLRNAFNGRLNKREQARREKGRLAAEAAERKLAEQRKAEADKAAADLAEATRKRQDAEAATKKAQEEKVVAEKATRDAKSEARVHEAGIKEADRDIRDHSADATRSLNRADRIEGRLNRTTEAELSQTRGDMGSVGSLTRSWKHTIVNEDMLRAGLAEATLHHGQPTIYTALVAELTSDALNGAVFRIMRLRQEGWRGTERIDDLLPGVTFSWDQGVRNV